MNNWVNWVIFGCLAVVLFIYVVRLAREARILFKDEKNSTCLSNLVLRK